MSYKHIIIWLFILFVGCDDRLEEREPANVIVTMLRIPRIELYDYEWETPLTIWGELESDDVDVTGMRVKWLSDIYWDENDSTGFYKTLCRRCPKAVWYDLDGSTDTVNTELMEWRWITEKYSMVDSLGRFYNTLRPVRPMVSNIMWLWWYVEESLVDSQPIFLME